MSTHDNLSQTDGNEENKVKTLDTNSDKLIKDTTDELLQEDVPVKDTETIDSEVTSTKEDLSTETDATVSKNESLAKDELAAIEVHDEVINEMEEAVAKDSEDESKLERHDIEKKDYHAMTKEELIKELRHLISTEKIQAIKEHAEDIKNEFNEKFNEEVEQKKEEFLAEGGNIIDFHYSTPLKKEFNTIYFDYKEKRNTYYQNLKKDLQANLQKRLDIIEELKGLLNMEENITSTYNHFKNIKEKWHNAGPIPRDKYNTVWNTYHHHTENFYDFLHLNRDFRDLDFKHNLEQKLKIIERATELAQDSDVNRAFRELQILHKMWKEDLGPVGKEYREPIWEKFSELTKKIHDNRQQYFKEQDKVYEKNLEVKEEIISKITTLAADHPKNHSGWQQKIKDIEALREEFFNAGKVPSNVNEKTWSKFKNAVRDFNRNKNNYYKGLKKDQFDNLNKKMELIKIAEDNRTSDDFSVTTPLMKKIQSDWKKIGHVPRKDSDKIWKRFKDACNAYFDRVHEEKNEANNEEIAAHERKEAHIETLKTTKLSGDVQADLATIKENINVWKTLGRVPYKKRNIESDYNKILDGLFEQLNLSRQETEMVKYENKLNSLANQEDDRALRNEQIFIRKKIDEAKGEINQLENNLLFFKHAKDDNPLVLDVKKNIQKHKDNLEVWKTKLKKIKQL